jgi:hypothetical protein
MDPGLRRDDGGDEALHGALDPCAPRCLSRGPHHPQLAALRA